MSAWTEEDDNRIRELCRDVDVGSMGSCPKCGMAGKEMALAFFCTHKYCPIREWSTGKRKAERGDADWLLVGDGTPLGIWLETKREGEAGTNICMARMLSIGGEPEWIEKAGGRTTITHHSFAAPTHWRRIQ